MVETKVKKTKGPVRWEAIIPFAIVSVLIWAYMHFLFDSNVRSAMEWIGYKALGSEVNIGKFESSFINGKVRIQNIQLTDSEKPTHNSLELGDIRFGWSWDGLLRAKVVIDEMAVEEVKIGTKRTRTGKVKPPEPKSNEPSALEKEAERLKNKAIDSTKKDYSENVLGDLAAMLSGTSGNDQMKNIEGTLQSKTRLAELDQSFKEKSKVWEQKFNALPQAKEIQSLGDRLGKIKTNNFSSPQELQDSLNQFNSLVQEADQKYKLIQSASSDLSSDYKTLETGLKELEELVKKDIKDLEARFKIPKLDAKSISQSLFKSYLNPYLSKFEKYKAMAEKYMPPKLMKKGTKDPDTEFQPRPREKGISYEFGRPNSYPSLWIKKVSLSSQAGSSPDAGNVSGLIQNITTHQALIGKPTTAKIEGDFPSENVRGMKLDLSMNNIPSDSIINANFEIGSYAINGREVVRTPDLNLGFKDASSSLKIAGTLVGLKTLDFKLANQMEKVSYDIESQNSTLKEILVSIFAGIPTVKIDANIHGEFPQIDTEISSNIGPEIAQGFQKQLQAKIDEARAKIQTYVNDQVGKEKAKLESEINKVKAQVEAEVKKLQDAINKQKSQAEAKVNDSKKSAEDQVNREKKKAEDQAKQSLQKEAEKAAEELKKKLGF